MALPVMKWWFIFILAIVVAIGFNGCSNGGDNHHEVNYWNTDVLVPFGHRPMPSPDGNWIAFGGTGDSVGIWLYDTILGVITRLTDDTHPHRWDYQWLPNSLSLVFGGAGEYGTATAGIWQTDFTQGILTRVCEFGGDPDPSPNGQTVCFAGLTTESNASGIWVVGITVPQINRLKSEGEHPRYSPDGNWITYLVPTSYTGFDLHLMNQTGGSDRVLADSIISQEWFDNQTLICLALGDDEIRIIKVTVGVIPLTTNLVIGGSELGISDSQDMIVFQLEENGHSLGLAITSSLGGGNKRILPSGAYPQFRFGTSDIVFEDTEGIVTATASD
jgi:hypothetical protein